MERLYLDVENPMYPFLEDLEFSAPVPYFFKVLDLSQVSNTRFIQHLQHHQIEWPDFSIDILQRYINHLAAAGHLPSNAIAAEISP